ncbi:MAG: hypothetical protein ACOCXG_02535 [Nanoarchaeota archaeon]
MKEELDLPNFEEIELVLNRRIYENEDTRIEIVLYYDEIEKTYTINLECQNKIIETNIITRIALEKHNQEKHDNTHLQVNINNEKNGFFNNGVIHINLIMNSENELLRACKGFTYNLVEVLNIIEKELDLKENQLKEHFFIDLVEEFRIEQEFILKKIKESVVKDKIHLIEENLVEIKNKKSTLLNSKTTDRKVFFILKLINFISTLKPILEKPLIDYIIEHSHLRQYNLNKEKIKEIISQDLERNQNFEKHTISTLKKLL